MYFEIIGEVSEIEIIARGRAIREVARLRKKYGPGRWRKLKGQATVRLAACRRETCVDTGRLSGKLGA